MKLRPCAIQWIFLIGPIGMVAVKVLSSLEHLPLSQHGSGPLLNIDEAYALSYKRILQKPPRAAVPSPEPGRQITMARKSKKHGKSKNRKRQPRTLKTVQPNAAGIDLGSREHWVAGPPLPDGSPNVQ